MKGYGTGTGQGQNKTHQVKKLDMDSLRYFRDRFNMPFSDDELEKVPFFKLAEDSVEMRYMRERREKLGGSMLRRRTKCEGLAVPELGVFGAFLEGSGDRELSTTMGLVRIMSTLIKQKGIGDRVVPIVPDEARTFGMEGLFRQLGIYSSVGQLYQPEDAGQVMFYREDQKGRILEEGINEAGAMSAWISAATSYSTHGVPMIPIYTYYSMFGFQRVGDLCWAAGDIGARGFLIGATSGRTTLNGEGLQHQDGHSHLLSSTIPNCVSYDPAFNHELAVIFHNGLERMYQNDENVYYYITTMNENYKHPVMPPNAEEGIIKGMYLLEESQLDSTNRVQLLGSGSILREVMAAANILQEVYNVSADVWSVTSFSELRRDGMNCERWNMLHPESTPQVPWVSQCLRKHPKAPVVASTDYMRIVSDQIRPYFDNHFVALGTDGFGRSDSREKLREFFEVDRYFVVVAALHALADEGQIGRSKVADAIERFKINPDKANPMVS